VRLHPQRHCRSAAIIGLLVVFANGGAILALDLEGAKARFSEIAAAEARRDVVPGFSVAWIVDGQTVHAAGYGLADRRTGAPATADTLYRAGSISKLFNALAAMQLVEQGKLDLDAPIEQALPEFRIVVPFADAKPITARQLLCHRSGMIRESPVGGYLDNRQPTVQATIASVADCVLVNPPDTKTRYSNVGPTIVGRAVEVHTGQEYAEYQQQHILNPLGMTGSAWRMNDTLRPRLAKGEMRVACGNGTYSYEPAPEFELGTLPAGNLYTSASDLARFASFVMGGPKDSAPSPVVKPETLASMHHVQLTNENTGFGLGFFAGRYRGHKTAQHSGAVYGFTTAIVVMPEERIGVVVLSNGDIAMAPVKRLTDASLDLLLEAVRGEMPPAKPQPIDIPAESLGDFTGEFESSSYWAKTFVESGVLRCLLSGQRLDLTPISPTKFLADGRMMSQSEFEFERGQDGKVSTLKAAGQTFQRVAPDVDKRARSGWQRLIGSYGLRFIPLIISVRHGNLYASVENEYEYRLTPVNRVTFALPAGMYSDEQIVFQEDTAGNVIGLVMANMYLPRND
jgi:serine beta-lactamase-like protein LACTB